MNKVVEVELIEFMDGRKLEGRIANNVSERIMIQNELDRRA